MSGARPSGPRQRRSSSVVAPALARRAADIPLQQLLEAQQAPTAPRARRMSLGGVVPQDDGGMVPYAPRARRMSSIISPVLPTETSALPLMAQTIPEEGEEPCLINVTACLHHVQASAAL